MPAKVPMSASHVIISLLAVASITAGFFAVLVYRYPVVNVITTSTMTLRTLFQDERVEKVGGDGVIGWMYGFGELKPGDRVRFTISSVYKVLVCLDQLPSSTYGWHAVKYYHNCAYAEILDEGSREWVVEKIGFYGLNVGKQAGYIASSFQIKLEVVRAEQQTLEITTTTTRGLLG